MASELRVNTLKDASGNNSIATSFVANGSAKAWVNLNGTGTIAERDSLNVSGLVDNGTGIYTANLVNSFGATDFAVSGTSANGSSFTFCTAPSGTVSASNISAFTSGAEFALADASTVSLLGYGDLA